MKPTAIADLRMRLLKRALKAHTMAEAIGVMELTWHFAAEYFPDGRIPMNAAAHLCAYSLRDFDDPVGELLMPIEESGWATWEDDVFLVLADWEHHRPAHLAARERKAVSRDRGVTTTDDHPPDEPLVTGQGGVEVGENCTCHATSHETRGKGEGGIGVSEDCALGEGYALGTEGAKPPKKTQRPPVTADQVQIPPEMDNPLVRASLDEWLTYRRRTGRPYRDPTYVTKTLAEYIDDPPGVFTAAVNYSIGQGYQGLFRAGQQRPTTGQTRRTLAANAFDLVEKELGE